jgi:hypothetical protein
MNRGDPSPAGGYRTSIASALTRQTLKTAAIGPDAEDPGRIVESLWKNNSPAPTVEEQTERHGRSP